MEAALLDEFARGDAREREESWRYSKPALRALAQQTFADANAQADVSPSLIERWAWAETQGSRIVFVNGAFAASLSNIDALAASVRVEHGSDHSLALTICADVPQPIHLVYANIPGLAPSRWSARTAIHVTNARATIVEQHVGDSGADVLGALVSDLQVGARSEVRYVALDDVPASCSLYRRVDADIATSAMLDAVHALFGGRLQRFDLNVGLVGERARFVSHGAFGVRGREHVDVHFDVRHRARDTACDLVWRGIADERGRGVFHGAITVEAGADGAEAQLSNKNLLLSANAEIDTQPVLEIHADEVKAAHGATVGQLDERALFYLRSRGLPTDIARGLLIGAFCRSVFADAPLRDRIDALLDLRLGANGERA